MDEFTLFVLSQRDERPKVPRLLEPKERDGRRVWACTKDRRNLVAPALQGGSTTLESASSALAWWRAVALVMLIVALAALVAGCGS